MLAEPVVHGHSQKMWVCRQWRVAAMETMMNWGDTDPSQQIKVVKTILHPGEVRVLTIESEYSETGRRGLSALLSPVICQLRLIESVRIL